MNDPARSGLCRGVDDDSDLALHDLLSSARLAQPPADRRAAVASAARRRRWRRRSGAAVAASIFVGVAIGALARGPDDAAVTAGPPPTGEEREIRLAGLTDPVRVSETLQPVVGAEAFGAVPLGGGAITGATQTSLADGSVVVLLALTPGPRTTGLKVIGPALSESVREVVDGPTLVVIELRDRDPHLVLTVATRDADGETIASERIAPFVQDPLTCDTAMESVGGDGPATPTYMRHLDAYLAAPLLPACDP